MKTMINIKTESKVKENAQKVAEELGIPLGTVINAFLRQFIRSREVYLSDIPKMTLRLEEFVAEARKDYKAKKNISPIFSSAKDAGRYLDSL